jgi:hypothetical protein
MSYIRFYNTLDFAIQETRGERRLAIFIRGPLMQRLAGMI